jgi:hypothetical protein
MRRIARVICMIITTACLASCAEDLPNLVEFDGVTASLSLGPEHCSWDDTWMVLIGPDDRIAGLDVSSGDGAIEHVFIRDPRAIPEYTFEKPGDLDRDRPLDAQLLGASDEGFELWFSASDPHYLFVERAELSEAWVRAVEWTYCS